MYHLPQWVVWRFETRPGQVKPTKVPINPLTRERASSTDPSTWTDYTTALMCANSDPQLSGIGFILTPNDPYFLIDLDGCRDIDTGVMTPEAVAICNHFPGAAWELSQSGEGIHIIGMCDQTIPRKHRNKWDGWCEFYTADRFIAFNPSGCGVLSGNTDLDWTDSLQRVVPYRPTDDAGQYDQQDRQGPRDGWHGPSDDDELIRRMLASQGGTKARLDRAPRPLALWHADAHVLGQFYPDQTGTRMYDASAADQALMNLLAYWTGCDHDRMIRIFSRSALGQRDKWTKRSYYRNHTTRSSIRTTREVYNGNKSDAAEDVRREQRRLVNAELATALDDTPKDHHSPVLTEAEMLERLVYISSTTAVVDSETNVIYPSDVTARKDFAASITMIPTGKIDPATGDEKTAKVVNFDLWFSHPKRQSRHGVGWLPNGPKIIKSLNAPGLIDHNTWRGFVHPAYAAQMRGDDALRESWLQAWRTHLAYLVPIEDERVRFEQWLAHILQRPEEVTHTAYLMWTETHGIGRNWFASVLCEVLHGYALPNIELSRMLDAQFNSSLSRKLLAIVDEIKEGGDHRERHKRENQIRQIITRDQTEINEKNQKQRMEYVRARWLFFSNHPDALPFNNSDRRIWVIKNPTVKASDEYYDWLFGMLKRPEFISAVFAHLMWSVDLTDFKTGEHAPMNEAKKESIAAMEPPIVSDLKDMAATMNPDSMINSSAISARLAMDYGISAEGIHPKTWAGYLKSAGFIQIPHKMKLFGTREFIYIVRPEKLKVADFYDSELKTFRPGMADLIRANISGT